MGAPAATLFRFTRKPRWAYATGPCTLDEVLEIRGYRSVRLTLTVLGFEGASSPLLSVALETSASVKDGYVGVGRFTSIGGKGGVAELGVDYVMRYLRWNIVQLDGADAALFTLEGVARE